jgi:hypothetical protein
MAKNVCQVLTGAPVDPRRMVGIVLAIMGAVVVGGGTETGIVVPGTVCGGAVVTTLTIPAAQVLGPTMPSAVNPFLD